MKQHINYENNRYIAKAAMCKTEGETWIIDRSNCLYKMQGDEQFEVKADLSCYKDGRDFQYGIGKMLKLDDILFCFPSCGEFCLAYDINNGQIHKIDTGLIDELMCSQYVLLKGYIYVFLTGCQRALLEINPKTLTCRKIPEFEFAIKEYIIDENYFFSKTVIKENKKVYMDVWNTNKIIEYDLENYTARITAKFADDFRMDRMFRDLEGDFWASSQMTSELVYLKNGVTHKLQYDKNIVKYYIWGVAFAQDKAYFIPESGNILMIYDRGNDTFEYIKIHIDLDDEYTEDLCAFFRDVELEGEILTIWLGERGRVEFNINTYEQTHFKMEKFPGATCVEVLQKEYNLPKIMKTTMHKETINFPLEFFILMNRND